MDANTSDAIVATVGVAGTLLGLILGFLLQDRRRHEPTKRAAYARFVSLNIQWRMMIEEAHQAHPDAELKVRSAATRALDNLANETYETFGAILMLADRDVALVAMRAMASAAATLDAPRFGSAASDEARKQLDAFIEAARMELGERHLPPFDEFDPSLKR